MSCHSSIFSNITAQENFLEIESRKPENLIGGSSRMDDTGFITLECSVSNHITAQENLTGAHRTLPDLDLQNNMTPIIRREHLTQPESLSVNNLTLKDPDQKPTDSLIEVATSSNTTDKRKWDKKQACLYCGKLIAKLPRHLLAKHGKEAEVVQIQVFPTGSEKRKLMLEEIRKKGNYIYNVNIIKAGVGKIIPQKRSKSAPDAGSLVPCPSCYAFYTKTKLSRHYSTCSKKEDIKSKQVQAHGSQLLPIAYGASQKLKEDVISRMRNDDISMVIKHDTLILKLGSRLVTKHAQDSHLYGYISQKMREVARFLITARTVSSKIECLADCTKPENFEHVVEAVRIVSGYDINTGKYKIPSLALKIGHSLKKCAKIVVTECLINGLSFRKERAENFIKLCENEWSTNVSTGALATLYRNKWNMPNRLPLAEDVKLLNAHLCQERGKYMDLLTNAEVTTHNWISLAKVVLAQTLLFNRRRAGEVERMPVDAYNKKNNSKTHEDIWNTLSDFEKAISNTFARFEVRGKKGRRVPILLHPRLIASYDILMLYRQHVGIPEENNFFFATTNASMCHLRGSDVLRYFAYSCEAKGPETLTSTKLRKNVATMSQILNLSNHEMDQLANFMGHDIRVHREYYRLPDSTVQLAKISKILIAAEKGKLHHFKGKNLDEINVDVDRISDYEESTGSEIESELVPINTADNINVLPETKEDVSLDFVSNQTEKESVESKMSNKKQQKKKKQVSKAKQKKPWSELEKECIRKYFSRDIIRNKVPGKLECTKFISENPHTLNDRDWKAVKYAVYNMIQKAQKK